MQVGADDWSTVDVWWSSARTDQVANLTNAQWHVLDEAWLTDAWADIEPWWDIHATEFETTYQELQAAVAALTAQWEASDSRFDRDPLAEPWQQSTGGGGPFRITHEEDWSQLLAYLCRHSAGPFISALFGADFDREPTGVRREVRFEAPAETNRRIDILVDYPAQALSIEVKTGDEHYEKTPETAALIERHDTRDWTHVLLLPEHKHAALSNTFGTALHAECDPPLIESSTGPPIAVYYWREIAQTLRRMLLTAREPSPHWAATAYLGIALIEQRLLGFDPVPAATTGNPSSAEVPALWPLQTQEISAQMSYLDTLQTFDTSQD